MSDTRDFTVSMKDETISLSIDMDGVAVTVICGTRTIQILSLGQLCPFPVYAKKSGDFIRIEVTPRLARENTE